MTNLNYTMGKKNNRNNSGNSSQQRSARNNHTMGKKDNRNNGQSFFSKAPNTHWRSSGVSSTSSNGGIGRNNPSSHPSDRSQFEKSPIPKDSLVELMAVKDVKQLVIVKGVITEVYPEAFAYALSDHTSTIRVEIRPDDAKKADDNENRLEVGTRVQLMVNRENKIDFICCSSEDSCKILGNVLLENDHLEKDRALVSSDSVDPSTMLVEGCGLLIYVKPLSSFILIKGYPHEVGALYYAARYDKIREDLVEEQMSRLPVGMITNLEESIDKKYKTVL
ncbi:hypothetical protein C9374_007120 [Naegleria lovaniensis]|uniref:Uncharacterized protein n=1 Tax=Naegleria lovaniensis TaxID=51637 RepID=A0AA88H4U3_NAELO|nr:uncharacterized protein C9374_007120 [Naegleria lovaniensis]KAG2393589.1 hypothetical protein C9374_007120 [Naegleria lovaniensis]